MRIAATLLLLLAACQAPPKGRPYDGYLPDIYVADTAVFLVRDKRTGLPIAGATVRQHPEWFMGPHGWAPLWKEGVTDRFGIAHVHVGDDPLTAHWVVEASGYAPTEDFGASIQEEIELEPEVEVLGRILDVFGKPAAGIRVGYKLGCAHAPDLRTAVTDEQGRFKLRVGARGDLTFDGPGLRADYWSSRHLRPAGFPVATYHGLPGVRLSGRVDGLWARQFAGAVVWSDTSGRGPIAPLRKDGSFRLEGADPNGVLKLFRGVDGQLAELDPTQYRPGTLIRWRVDPKEEEEPVLVLVNVLSAASREPASPAFVYLDRREDDRRFAGTAEEGKPGLYRLAVPPGSYRLSVGKPYSRYFSEDRLIVVTGKRKAPLLVHAEERPRLEIEARNLAEPVFAHVCLRDRSWRIDLADRATWGYLPRHDRAVLRVRRGDRIQVFPIEEEREGGRRVLVDWPLPKTIRLSRIDGVFGEDYFVDVPWREFDYDEEADALLLFVHDSGPHEIVISHLERGIARMTVEVPDAPGAVVEAPEPIFEKAGTPRMRVLRADERPVAEAGVRVFSPQGETYGCTDPSGTLVLPGLRDGSYVGVSFLNEDEHVQPQYGRLRGPGPYVLRLGSAGIAVTIRAESGAVDRADMSLYVDGFMARQDDNGVFRVAGLLPGVHTLIAGALGHVPLVLQPVLKKGEVRAITLDLPKRDAPR
ncbi:MAG: hypothetical protein ACE10D_06890 [Planctomycetota bacterium]